MEVDWIFISLHLFEMDVDVDKVSIFGLGTKDDGVFGAVILILFCCCGFYIGFCCIVKKMRIGNAEDFFLVWWKKGGSVPKVM